MNRKTPIICGVLLGALMFCGCLSRPPKPLAETVPFLPPPVFKTSPVVTAMEEVPEVYYVSGSLNIFFYQNTWFYYCNDVWFVSRSFNGPWTAIETYALPIRFGQIPSKYIRPVSNQDRNK